MARRGAVLRGAANIPSAPGGARPTPAPQGSIPFNNGRGLNAPSTGQYSPLAAQLANEGGYARTYGPFLPRPTESFTAGAFGPFSPILPVPVDAPPPEFERPEPRRWEYTVGWNLPTGQPGNEGLRLANFETMRRLADVYSVARACIEYRKNQIRGVQWDIVPTPAAAKAYQGSPSQMADFGKRQAKATKFFNRPDPNYFSYSLWLSAMLEDVYVYDALSILIRPVWGKGRGKGVLGSDLDSLMLLTGSTIRPLVDLHGGIPRPPAPGYQQYLYGVPRSDYMTMMLHRDIEEAGMSQQDVAQFRGDQLLYLPMVPRAWTPYGFSAIERAIIPIMTGLQKQAYQYDFFEEGTVPAAYIIPGDTAMTPNQLRELQDALNAIAGDPAWKQKLIVLPPGSHVEPQRPVITADELDQLVMSQVTMAFGVTPLELGLSPGRSSSTSSGAANQMSKMTQNNSQDVNITPMLQFLQDIFNGILEHVCGQTDMMFTFEGLQQEEDMDALTGVLVQQFQNGMRTLDECRQELNLQPYGLEESSEPLIVTPTGPTPLSTAVANAQNAAAQSAAQAQQTQAQAGQTQAQTGATQANTAATQSRTQISQESHEVRMNETPPPPPGLPGGAKPQPTGAAGAEGKAEAAQNASASQGNKPTPGHNAAQASNNEAASTKKSVDVTGIAYKSTRQGDAEFEALTRHLTKGRHVTTWEARHISEASLAVIAKAMAEGLEPYSAVSLAKAQLTSTDVVLPKSDYQWQDDEPAGDAVTGGEAPFRGVETADLVKVGPKGYIHGWIKVDRLNDSSIGLSDDEAEVVAKSLSIGQPIGRGKAADDIRSGIKQWTHGVSDDHATDPASLAKFKLVVHHAQPTAPELHRGLVGISWPGGESSRSLIDQLSAVKSGDIVTTDRAASWSDKEKIARGFAGEEEGSHPPHVYQNVGSVVLRIQPGARAVPVKRYAETEFKSQNEWVSPPSKYEVISNEPHPVLGGSRLITVKEVSS
jgi:hypothetical protein